MTEEEAKIMAIEFTIDALNNIPTGMFDSTPYVQKQMKSLEEELKKLHKGEEE